MKKPVLILFFSLVSCYCFSQAGEWTWINGDSYYNSPGHYGTKGVPSPLNTPPALYEACEWTDLQGNFWLYGGLSVTGGSAESYADLWKFNPITNEWTWMFGKGLADDTINYGIKGVSSPNNTPGSRLYGTGTWVDLQGNLWLYGGFSIDTANGALINGQPVDLWKYDISINQWTWVNGFDVFYLPNRSLPSTSLHPGSRMEFNSTWTDIVGNLWMFGGIEIYDDNNYGDLWKYNITADTWTLVKGDTIPNQMGSYGIMGVSSPTNIPSCRGSYSKWKDSNGDFWLFGGMYYNSNGTLGNFKNDLWKYTLATNTWTWMNGDSTNYSIGNFGTKCMPSSTNQPGARFENRVCWTDHCNNLWTFGGVTSGGPWVQNNDLWVYNISIAEWTWVSGNNFGNAGNTYGNKGVPSPTNIVGARTGSIGWSDLIGNLWLFGGTFNVSSGGGGIFNDLWRYVPDSTCGGCFAQLPIVNLSSTDTIICEKTCIDFTDLSINNPTSWQWFFPGADSATSTLQNPTNICYNTYGSFDITLIACNPAGCDTLVLPGFINAYPLPAPVITSSFDTLFSSPAVTYQWWSVVNGIIPGANNIYFIPTQLGNYFVKVTDILGCLGISDTLSITALIPSPNLMSSDTLHCEKTCIDFYDLSTNNPTSWQWFFPGADTTSSILQYPFHICYNTYGTFDVTLIACNSIGCDTLILPNFIQIYQAPPAPVITISNDTLNCITAANGYQWYLNNAIITGATDSFYVFTMPGDYYVIITDSNSCNSASNLISITGINQWSMVSGQLSIIPNPAKSVFTVSFIIPSKENVELRIFDALDKEIYFSKHENVQGKFEKEITVNGFANGIYLFQLKTNNGIVNKKVIVQH